MEAMMGEGCNLVALLLWLGGSGGCEVEQW